MKCKCDKPIYKLGFQTCSRCGEIIGALDGIMPDILDKHLQIDDSNVPAWQEYQNEEKNNVNTLDAYSFVRGYNIARNLSLNEANLANGRLANGASYIKSTFPDPFTLEGLLKAFGFDAL